MSSSSFTNTGGNASFEVKANNTTPTTNTDPAATLLLSTKTKKKQRWSRSEKRAAALQEEKTRPLTNRFLQCAQQCPLGARILQSPEKDTNVLRVVTSTSSPYSTSTLNRNNDAHHIHIKPLLILDLNGILCHRIRKSKEHHPHTDDASSSATIVYRPFDAHVARTPVVARPHLHAFIQQLLASNVCLALWTSAKRKTVHALLEQLQIPITHFLFVWGQDQCLTTATTDDNANHLDTSPLFQKDLQKVWIRYPLWNESNTLLMDDSMEKIISSQEHMAMHPIPLNGRQEFVQSSSSSCILHDEHVRQEQDLFVQHYVQHWQQHALWQEYATDETNPTATTNDPTNAGTTTRWQWESLRDYSRPTMRWGGDSLGRSSYRGSRKARESSTEET